MKKRNVILSAIMYLLIVCCISCDQDKGGGNATVTENDNVTPSSMPSNRSSGLKHLKIATLEWPPYVGKSVIDNGFTTEIVRSAFEKAGYKVTFEFMPWKRVLAEVESGQCDAGYPAYYTDDRAQTYSMTKPFANGPLVFFKHKDSEINYNTLEDLKGKKIGIVRGYVNTPEFDSADYMEKIVSNSDLQNLRLLLKKRIDLAVVDKYAGMYLLNTNLSDQKDDLEFIEPVLKDKTLHVMISRNDEESDKLAREFDDALQLLEAEGAISEILEKCGFNK